MLVDPVPHDANHLADPLGGNGRDADDQERLLELVVGMIIRECAAAHDGLVHEAVRHGLGLEEHVSRRRVDHCVAQVVCEFFFDCAEKKSKKENGEFLDSKTNARATGLFLSPLAIFLYEPCISTRMYDDDWFSTLQLFIQILAAVLMVDGINGCVRPRRASRRI